MQNQTILDVSRIMSRGQVVIPKKIREELRLTPQTLVGFIRSADGVVLKRLQSSFEEQSLQQQQNSLILQKPTRTREEFLSISAKHKTISWTKKSDLLLKKDRQLDRHRLRAVQQLKPYWK